MNLAKVLIIVGSLLLLTGLYLSLGGKLPPLGRLPGDMRIQRENFSVYFPWMTCLLISLILSLLAWIFRR